MNDRIAALVLGLPGWAALIAVFALPALESSAFVGFIFPGEIALLLGGVLAQQGHVPVVAVLAAGFAGAVLGDSLGYAIGHRYRRRVLDGALGRFVKRDHLDRAERFLADRGGRAVFLGRFTAALRVMVPGAAGMVRMRYLTFLVYNVAGAAGWVTLSVMLGYLGGSSWQHVAHTASRVGLVALVALVLLLAGGVVWRRARGTSWAAVADRLQGTRIVRRARSRFPRAAGWVGRRIDPFERRGLPATVATAVLVASTWTFLGITEDVASRTELAHVDPGVHSWVLQHRTGALNLFFQLVTHLGSNLVLLPVLAVGVGTLAWRRRTWSPVPVTALVYGGAAVLHAVVALWVQRPRPPQADWLAPGSGWAYTSGHTTQAWAGWGILTLLAFVYAGRRVRLIAVLASVAVATLVSISRVYLGVHWLTDVLGGTAMSVAILAGCCLGWLLWTSTRADPGQGDPQIASADSVTTASHKRLGPDDGRRSK